MKSSFTESGHAIRLSRNGGRDVCKPFTVQAAVIENDPPIVGEIPRKLLAQLLLRGHRQPKSLLLAQLAPSRDSQETIQTTID
jgi:hypothetical protein